MKIEWVNGFEIHVNINDGAVIISANREGLLSLANQLTALAGEAPGSHIHYDKYNSLEEGSIEMIIEKMSKYEPLWKYIKEKDLSKYDKKHVRVTDKWGETFTGLACYGGYEFLMHEYGGKEDGIFIEDCLIYNSQITSIEEIEVHGTAELWTERLILRRYCPEDAEPLYRRLGTDPSMYQYSGWNPYATLEMAQETVCQYIDGYDDEHFYSWVIDIDDVLVGTIGAYDYKDDHIEVGFSVVREWQGRGLATEALKKVLEYLTENEGIPRVTAWCAADNIGSEKAVEAAGMTLVNTEKNGLVVGDRVYDKRIYEYRRQ